jgi:hypothetical protein
VAGFFFIDVLLFSLVSFFVVNCTAMTMMTMGDGLDAWMDILVAGSGEVGLGEMGDRRKEEE